MNPKWNDAKYWRKWDVEDRAAPDQNFIATVKAALKEHGIRLVLTRNGGGWTVFRLDGTTSFLPHGPKGFYYVGEVLRKATGMPWEYIPPKPNYSERAKLKGTPDAASPGICGPSRRGSCLTLWVLGDTFIPLTERMKRKSTINSCQYYLKRSLEDVGAKNLNEAGMFQAKVEAWEKATKELLEALEVA